MDDDKWRTPFLEKLHYIIAPIGLFGSIVTCFIFLFFGSCGCLFFFFLVFLTECFCFCMEKVVILHRQQLTNQRKENARFLPANIGFYGLVKCH